MEITRKVKIDAGLYMLGDVISFELNNGEKVDAMAVKQEGNNMLFCFVDCPSGSSCQRNDISTFLTNTLLPMFPKELSDVLIPFESGDLLRIPTEREIFGENTRGTLETIETEQWECMKVRKNRVAYSGVDGSFDWYWLQNASQRCRSMAAFAIVNDVGDCDVDDAVMCNSIRAVFQIRN